MGLALMASFTPTGSGFWIWVALIALLVGFIVVVMLVRTLKALKGLAGKFAEGQEHPEDTPVTFRPAGWKEITYNLTASLELGDGTLVATGKKHHFTDNLEVGVMSPADPAELARRVGTVRTGDVRLEIKASGIRLIDQQGDISLPRTCLEHVYCVSAQAEAKSVGSSSGLIYVCLHFNDERLRTVVIDAFPFTIGIASLVGTQQAHKYTDAVVQAENRAGEVAAALGVPYKTNYYTGIFAPLANIYR
jgi:hypothetical protein